MARCQYWIRIIALAHLYLKLSFPREPLVGRPYYTLMDTIHRRAVLFIMAMGNYTSQQAIPPPYLCTFHYYRYRKSDTNNRQGIWIFTDEYVFRRLRHRRIDCMGENFPA